MTHSGLFCGLSGDRPILLVISIPGFDTLPTQFGWESYLDIRNAGRDGMGSYRSQKFGVHPPLTLVRGLFRHASTVSTCSTTRAHIVTC